MDAECDISVEEVIKGTKQKKPENQLTKARRLIQNTLAGGSVLADEMLNMADEYNISHKTFYRAKSALGVISVRHGDDWYWEMPIDVVYTVLQEDGQHGQDTYAATANRIGYDLAMKLTHGEHAFICCTHLDNRHIHSHIVINSTSLDCTKKFRNFKGSSFAIRRIADHLCIENGLSIITNPKLSRGSYGKWLGDKKPETNREKLERMIDGALKNAKDFDGFLTAMTAAGCEIKRGKNLAFKIPGADRFARCKSLGEDYTEEAIMERLNGLRKVIRKPPAGDSNALFVPFSITGQTKFGLLIDILKKNPGGQGRSL